MQGKLCRTRQRTQSEKMTVVSCQWSAVGFRIFLILSALCVLCGVSSSQGLPMARPEAIGMNSAKLNLIEGLVNADIAEKKLPGAVVIVGHRGKIVYRKAFGNRSLVPTVEKMTVDTIFDVASLTKVVSTTTLIMALVERGILRLNDTVGKLIPDIEDEQAKRVTIQQLLTHTAGYAPDFDLKEKWTGRDGMLAALKKETLRTPPGTRFVYSDIGFIVLFEIVQRVCSRGCSGPSVFSDDTQFRDLLNHRIAVNGSRYAPTENIRGQSSYLGGSFEGDAAAGNQILRGWVHDPTAFRMGGEAGHAGLFSTADDLARFCQ